MCVLMALQTFRAVSTNCPNIPDTSRVLPRRTNARTSANSLPSSSKSNTSLLCSCWQVVHAAVTDASCWLGARPLMRNTSGNITCSSNTQHGSLG
jgi:hypothetical protein